MTVNDISAISANPLGMMGLNYSGMYGSYPMLGGYGTGINGMSFGMDGMYGMGGMGMMGMYNPAFMQGMMQTQQAIEKSQVDHASDMHNALNQAEVNNLSAHNRALFQKISDDSEIQSGVRHLADLIRGGDSDGVCIEFEKLRSNILTKFAKEISQDPTCNPKNKVDEYIKRMYKQILTAQGQQAADFDEDLKSYGEGAFWNGFNKNFLGNKGHNEKYAEEAIAYINGTRLNDKGSKENAQLIGKGVSKVAELGVGGAAGAAGGTIAFLGGTLLGMKGSWKKFGKFGKYGIIAGLVGDALWQLGR